MLAYVFVVLAVVIRFVPHPFSFTPVGAALLFFGARGPRRQAWIPVLLLAGSDLVLTRIVYGYPYTLDHLATVAWYAAIVALGTLLRGHIRPARIAGAALGVALSFFLISNFAVWLAWSMYPRTLSGLAACYAAGIPFFRNEVVCDVLFSAVFFSVPALVARVRPAAVKA